MSTQRPRRRALRLALATMLTAVTATVTPLPHLATPAQALDLFGIVQADGGASAMCGVFSSGSVTCWGNGVNFGLGNGSSANRAVPVTVAGVSGATKVVVGASFGCALLSGGTVKCWGDNQFGQLGTGSFNHPTTAVTVSGVSNAVDLAAGWAHACAVISGGTVKCWGNGQFGQIGTTVDPGSPTPTTVAGLTGVAHLALGAGHTCALTTNATVLCLGANSDGEIGNGTTSFSVATPTSPSGLSGVISLTAGHHHTCAVVTVAAPATAVKCWGANEVSQLGRASASTTPAALANPIAFAAEVDSFDNHTCAVTLSATAYCWGENETYQLGAMSPAESATPLLQQTDDAAHVVAASYWTCIVHTNTALTCHGGGYGGVLGSGDDTSRPGAAPVEAGLGEFQPLTPARLLDTRSIGTTVDGQSQKGGLVAAGSTVEVQVRGRGGVSNTTTAVALNLTAVNASGVGYITMWPCDASMPTASNLNTIATVARANMAISRVATSGPDTGRVCIYASVSTHLVLDVNGYSRGSAYTAITPVRLVDSRTIGTTVDGASTGWGPLNPFSAYVISLAGRGGVPANVGGLVINITAAQPGGTGYVTVWDCIGAKPPVSHLNLQSGVNVANLAVTTTNGTGHICVSSSVSTHLIIDVVGYFTSSSLVQLPAPYRISDSRANGSTFDGLSKAYGPVAAGGTVKVEVATRQTYTGHTSVARTVILTVTAVNPAGNGYFTVWPCGQPMPLASNLNVKAGVNFANTVFMSVGNDNEVCIYSSTQTQLVVDFDGYWFY